MIKKKILAHNECTKHVSHCYCFFGIHAKNSLMPWTNISSFSASPIEHVIYTIKYLLTDLCIYTQRWTYWLTISGCFSNTEYKLILIHSYSWISLFKSKIFIYRQLAKAGVLSWKGHNSHGPRPRESWGLPLAIMLF